MSIHRDERHDPGPVRYVRRVLSGTVDPRLRATWRVLLVFPLLLFPQTIASAVPAGDLLPGQGPMVIVGLVQAGVFAVLLVAWARYVDRRPLTDYGVTASRPWLTDLFVGFAAVTVGHVAWFALGTHLGWTSVEASSGTQGGALVLGLAAFLVALGVNVWVQETACFAVASQSAAEGAATRGLTVRHAALAGWLVGVLVFAGVHAGTLQRPELFVAGGVFGLLYVHTGELALPIGVHLGVNYAGNVLFPVPAVAASRPSLFEVTEALPGLLGSASAARLPQLLLAYLLLLAWLHWRRGGVDVAPAVARWSPR